MKRLTRREVIRLLPQIQDKQLRAAVVRKWLDLARQGKADFTEQDLAEFAAADVDAHYGEYKQLLQTHEESEALIRHFYECPEYLARALVRMYPEIFYMEGFAHRFVLKLQADLGPILRRPGRDEQSSDMSIFMESVPESVRRDLAELDRERRFREYLYLFSRDPSIGFEQLAQDIERAPDQYTKGVLQHVDDYGKHLIAMKFPGFVGSINGSLFPSFHVRWWLDTTRDVKRILNIGDTGTQKTAFAVVASHCFGCRRVLVLCPPHARTHWEREIAWYSKQAEGRTFTVRRSAQTAEVASSSAQYIIVAYTSIIHDHVLDALKNVPFDALIWDESHYAKNVAASGASKRALACSGLVASLPLQYVLALSATPWENHPGELAPIATALRPDLFQDPATLHRARVFDPRLLRELFASHILEVELREVVDLPPIQPKPWQDLFGADLLDMNPDHREMYEIVRESRQEVLEGHQKVLRLMLATIHPHGLQSKYEWPEHVERRFTDPALSTKLQWMRDRITRELAEGAKVVVGTGIYVNGITRPQDEEDGVWIGAVLREWFGEDAVLVLDGHTTHSTNREGTSARDRVIERWRSDPAARILLVSIRACPDAVNLSVPALPGITKLFLTTFSFPWIPWKQFLGRFWRAGLGVPFSYAVPVLRNTVDESLYRLVQEKWRLQQLFRAQVPLTNRELELFDRKRFVQMLASDARTSAETVNFMGRKIRGCTEKQAESFLNEQKGLHTNAERFAQAFVRIQDTAAPGHIARFMRQVICQLVADNVLEYQGILDAGCGPLTLERELRFPVHGVDMNEATLRLGRELSSHQGRHARCGLLTKLPKDWADKFGLTVASLVVDWASTTKKTSAGVPIRLAMLQELVRVTHHTGRVWLTFTRRSMDQSIHDAWCAALTRNEFKMVDELTGSVEATDHHKRPFSFWSICFCPEGKPLEDVHDHELDLRFEQSHIVFRRGGAHAQAGSTGTEDLVRHEHFVVNRTGGERMTTAQAAKAAVASEQDRLARLAEVPWRSLLEMQRRGIKG